MITDKDLAAIDRLIAPQDPSKPPPPRIFFDENPRAHVTVTGSSTGFLNMVFQLFGRKS